MCLGKGERTERTEYTLYDSSKEKSRIATRVLRSTKKLRSVVSVRSALEAAATKMCAEISNDQ